MSQKLIPKRLRKAAFIFGGDHELQRKGLVLDVGFMRPLLVWRGYWIDEGYVMSGFKGAPGPREHYGPHGCQHSIGGYIESGDGKVCDVSGFDVGREMAFKNAKLIAAAPELLDALQELVFLYEHDDGCRELAEYKRAKEAIKKALGN
ncbi:hypothetical protein [Serratia ureilytica]|uniref:Uncharacterized protein n=1 Tax=Serratia ureilytica TaxID=300181 RepID=A0A9X9BZU6_9GAMM|nr:hypothetical protein [Serratia ureilytica]TXE24490.1 hypothetical protein FOT63_23755 [Serratia ureilytica]